MKSFAAAAIAVFMVTLAAGPAVAGGGIGGGPVVDPGGDPGDPGGEPAGDPGNVGGSGPGNSGATPPAGMIVFDLNTLPTGPQGTQAFYQPTQDYTALGLGILPSAQTGLNQTVGSLTLSLRTATYVYDPVAPSTPQTRVDLENASTSFGYLGVPVANQVTVQAITLSPDAPGELYANFSDTLSSFSLETIRLFGAFQYGVTLTGYSGLNGTGSILGTTSGTVGSLSTTNYQSSFLTLSNLRGAQSIGILGTSGNVRYDNFSVALGAVPEPATWSLLIVGFGMSGVALRRQRLAAA